MSGWHLICSPVSINGVSRWRAVVVVSIAWLLTLVGDRAATGMVPPLVDVSTVPPSQSISILENNSLSLVFRLTNEFSSGPIISDIHVANPFFERLGVDPDDRVTAVTVEAANDFCTGFAVGPGGTCQFGVLVETADETPNDNDSGLWLITPRGSFSFVEDGLTESGLFIGDRLEVQVLDPTFTKVPEPSTLLLFVTGLAALGSMVWRRPVLSQLVREADEPT